MHDGVLWVGIGPKVNSGGAGGLAPDGDGGGVTAEGGDVGTQPLDGEALVEEARVGWEGGGAGEAEDVGAVVDGYDEDILGGGEILAVVEGGAGAAKVEFWEGW